jgi:ribosomal protein S13
MLGIAKNDVYSALSGLGISESVRIEALTMEQLMALAKELMKY